MSIYIIDQVFTRVFVRSLFNVSVTSTCDQYYEKRKKERNVFLAHSLSLSIFLAKQQPSRIVRSMFPTRRIRIHTETWCWEEHRTKRRKRECKAYPCRSLWRRVAITGGFIHSTPLTSSLGRSFTRHYPATPTDRPTIFHHSSFRRHVSRSTTSSIPTSFNDVTESSLREGWVLPLLSRERSGTE